jgi:hypothetical protein
LGAREALEGDRLRSFPYRERPRKRIYQFDKSKDVTSFPENPADAVSKFFVPGIASTPGAFRGGHDAPGLQRDRLEDLI